ncbi:hypothetical protein DSO57_1014612 [Entomophthora muscae]|uniref:Uncharacterized protein n=1 Tax=Entomophthora muscae TaxID=34485 RepID=A0ACC2UQF5_9FUNG|nr:hypothetical protein DSO57_1014612 [Entomophthora muscae]
MVCIGQVLEENLAPGIFDADFMRFNIFRDELIGVSIGARWNSDIIQIWNSSAQAAPNAKMIDAIYLAVEKDIISSPFYKGSPMI